MKTKENHKALQYHQDSSSPERTADTGARLPGLQDGVGGAGCGSRARGGSANENSAAATNSRNVHISQTSQLRFRERTSFLSKLVCIFQWIVQLLKLMYLFFIKLTSCAMCICFLKFKNQFTDCTYLT